MIGIFRWFFNTKIEPGGQYRLSRYKFVRCKVESLDNSCVQFRYWFGPMNTWDEETQDTTSRNFNLTWERLPEDRMIWEGY